MIGGLSLAKAMHKPLKHLFSILTKLVNRVELTIKSYILVTTIDQSWRQNRTPWNGSTFLSRKADINNNTNMHKAGSVLSRKTTKLEALNGRFETLISSGSQDLESASVSLGSMGLSQQSSYTDADKLNEKQTSRKKVVLLTDHSLKRMRETSNIYLQKNSAFHKQRLKKIETNIGSKHRAAIDRQLTEVEHIQKEKYKKSIQNMKELTNVRDRFWKEKKKRVKNTYVSVAALEMPEVDRYAYGLPADGKEYTFVKKRTMQSKSNTAEKWNESMQKARSIVKVLGLREKVERTMTLPILKPLTLHSKSKTNLNKEEVMEEEDINDNTEKTELRNLEGEDESKIDNFAENSADAGLNAINALLDLTSESKYGIFISTSISYKRTFL